MLNVIDVSTFQGDIDFDRVAKQVDGVIIRCGLTFWGSFVPSADAKWERNYAGFKAAGVPVGAYYYGVAKTTEQAREEAKKCLELLKGKQLELPIYYDVEEVNTQGNLTKAKLTEVVQAFCEALEEAGYYAGFYTMLNWAQTKLDYPNLARKHTSWIARIGPNPAEVLEPDPAAWQYNWRGKIDGIKGDVDQNYFYQDFPTIIKNAGLNGFGKDPEPEVPENNPSIKWDELRAMLEAKGIETIEL